MVIKNIYVYVNNGADATGANAAGAYRYRVAVMKNNQRVSLRKGVKVERESC